MNQLGLSSDRCDFPILLSAKVRLLRSKVYAISACTQSGRARRAIDHSAQFKMRDHLRKMLCRSI